MGCERACDCQANAEGWPSADFTEQSLLAASALAFLLAGGRAVLRNRPRWFPVWFAGLLGWAIIPKYYICTRCENYGKSCDFFYGGKYAAMFFSKQEAPFDSKGYFAEGVTLATFQSLPAIAARRDPKRLLLYALSAGIFQALLIKFCCIDCVRNARDQWKADYCPTFKIVEKLGLAGRKMCHESDLETSAAGGDRTV